ncbi:hypothetical protein HY061_01275 [Candidatus Azambacteria bacterium]|nr:hypothetical protein [Candidatus Azambacteria bacterium]
MTNNNSNMITENPLQKINDFLKLIGFSDEKIAEHHERLTKLILMSVADELEKLSAFKEKEPFPKELKSIEDFFGYYGKYVDKEMMAKIVKEKYYKFYSEYISAMDNSLKEIDKL